MKHISKGLGRICGKSTPERGEYVPDAVWRTLPECPECFGESNTTLAAQEPKVHKPEKQPTITKQGLYLRQYLR